MKNHNSYKKAIDYIFSLRKPRENYTPGIHINRLKKFLKFAGNPHNDYKIIHVGGTSGKGSVTYLTSKILIEHGLKVGTHMSPNLLSLNEKFMLNLTNISDSELIDLVDWLKASLTPFEKENHIFLSYYEGIVAMVFKYFSIKKVDIAVIEVGVGGKLDATNVVNSTIAILTNVGLDHMELLGNTKEEILADKVEIMKPSRIFITAVKEANLLETINLKAQVLNNQLLILNKDFSFEIIKTQPGCSYFNFKNHDITIKNIKLSLDGLFQLENASLAIQASICFLKDRVKIPAILTALETSQFLGRMQTLSQDPLIILDGAHNEAKMRALAYTLKANYSKYKINLLIAFKKGKDLDLILEQMVDMPLNQIIITEFQWEYYDRLESFKAEEVKNALRKYLKDVPIVIIKNNLEAYKYAQNSIRSQAEMLLVTGSLYLIGTLLQKINHA